MKARPRRGGNGTFASLTSTSFNGVGQVAFRATLSGTSGGTADAAGVFRGNGAGTPVQIARAGQVAPGGNGQFLAFTGGALDDAGRVAFVASLSGTGSGTADDTGIFRGNGDSGPSTIAREGQPAPGGNGSFPDFTISAAVNDAGQVAFTARLTGTNGGSADNSGVYFADASGALMQIVRAGQAAPGGSRFASVLSLPAINGSGDVAFSAQLTAASNNVGMFRADSAGGLIQIVRKG